ncbi:MAG: alginate export family protein [Woeseiaceae bacterium]|nr:alginate export family protein [Woeseiaceae bacterium]
MTIHKWPVTAGLLAWMILVPAPGHSQEGADSSLESALADGEAHFAFRYRYEHVDQDGFSEDANASTVRLRLNYKTGTWRKLWGFVEFDYIAELLLKDFNSLGGSSPERNRYPVVADPKGPDLNQLFFEYAPDAQTRVRAGRERIVLDNHRFVGDVGWRQNTQTYDAAGIDYSGFSDTQVFYRYVTAVRRINGDNVPAGRHDNDTHLLNVRIKLSDDWNVIPYLYAIDNKDVAVFSTTTFGARVTGKAVVAGGKLDLVAEIATQSDAANNPVNYDADYWHAAATWTLENGLSVGLAFDSLGGDASVAGASFRTPLATLHAHQGWADKFLATPAEGIEDLFVTVKYQFADWNLTGVWHDFSAEAGSSDWGTELDLSLGRRLNDRYGILFKAALYDADQHLTDTNKFWIMFTGNY